MAMYLPIIFLAISAWAGHETGHGGAGIVCPQKGNTLKLLDLQIAELHGLKIFRTNSVSVDDQIKNALDKLSKTTQMGQDDPAHNLEVVRKAARFDSNGPFPVPTDLGDVSFPNDCTLLGLASYRSGFLRREKMIVNFPAYELLSNTDKAALWVHETIYRMNRWNDRARNSARARRIVGILFSDEDFSTLKWPQSH